PLRRALVLYRGAHAVPPPILVAVPDWNPASHRASYSVRVRVLSVGLARGHGQRRCDWIHDWRRVRRALWVQYRVVHGIRRPLGHGAEFRPPSRLPGGVERLLP